MNQDKDKAEGSRENVNTGEKPGGITNRPPEREQREQGDVPARGQRKDEDRGADSDRDPAMPQDDATQKKI